jgi:hypothetical protein
MSFVAHKKVVTFHWHSSQSHSNNPPYLLTSPDFLQHIQPGNYNTEYFQTWSNTQHALHVHLKDPLDTQHRNLKYKWSYPEEFSDLICCIDKWNFNGTKQHFGVAITRERPVQWCHEHRYNSCLWNSWTVPALLHPTTFYAVVKQTELLVQCRKVKFSFVVVSLVWLEVDKLTPLSKNSSWECEAEQWGGVAYKLKP